MKTNKTDKTVRISIPPAKFGVLHLTLIGDSMLVQDRFDQKSQDELQKGKIIEPEEEKNAPDECEVDDQPQTQLGGRKPTKKKIDPEKVWNERRYISAQGWDGFKACALRNGSVDAIRLVKGLKMNMAKMSIFVMADGYDRFEDFTGLVKIIGKPERFDYVARNRMGQAVMTHRPRYWPWKAKVRIRFDAGQFDASDIINLINRVGMQIGVGCGRVYSKNSCGQGWGAFHIDRSEKAKLEVIEL